MGNHVCVMLTGRLSRNAIELPHSADTSLGKAKQECHRITTFCKGVSRPYHAHTLSKYVTCCAPPLAISQSKFAECCARQNYPKWWLTRLILAPKSTSWTNMMKATHEDQAHCMIRLPMKTRRTASSGVNPEKQVHRGEIWHHHGGGGGSKGSSRSNTHPGVSSLEQQLVV
eukprot:1119362-Pelagomonas_calceolata.AAC.2